MILMKRQIENFRLWLVNLMGRVLWSILWQIYVLVGFVNGSFGNSSIFRAVTNGKE